MMRTLSLQKTALRPRRVCVVSRASSEKPRFSMDIMRFDSFAPELINGRLAMLGYASGSIVKNVTGEAFSDQLVTNIVPFAAATAIITAATLVPIARGVDPRQASDSDSYTAEVWIGRLAMLGFALTLVVDGFHPTVDA